MRRIWISGGFAPSPTRSEVEERALAACGAEPNVCLLAAASGDSRRELSRFYEVFADAQPTHVSLFRRRRRDHEVLANASLIVLSGGNPANLLALLRLHAFEAPLLDAYRTGACILGVSAGASVLFDVFLTDSFGPPLRPVEGLGVLRGSFCPHAARPKRRARFVQCVGEGMAGGLGVADEAYVAFEDEQLISRSGDVVRVQHDGSRTRTEAL